MVSFLESILYNFLIAFGIIVGASFFAGLAAIISNNPPLKTMLDVSKSLKIWAVAATIGGTFSSLEVIESGLFKGDIKSFMKQAIYIISALIGANTAYSVLRLIEKCGDIWFLS